MSESIEVSVTVTSGEGSEKHNHDIEYRAKKLTHTHDTSKDTVKELVPYEKSYKEQINELMKDYIVKYNQEKEKKYKESYQKFEKGLINNRPKKKDFKPLPLDYYSTELNKEIKNKKTGKYEKKPMFRSLILGIGDQNDKNKISPEQAERLFRRVTEEFKKNFPDFKVLGSTFHNDEQGFYHMHLDFFVMSQKKGKYKGLSVTSSLDTALKNMDYEPEQSIINGRDKVPILFNAFRNKIYSIMETEMRKENIGLQYGVSATKDPKKNSSRNQKLDVWQETKDNVRKIQHLKNQMMTEIDTKNPNLLPNEEIDKALSSKKQLQEAIERLQSAKRTRLDKNKGIVEFSLIDQIKSFLASIMDAFEAFAKKIGELEAQLKESTQKLEKANKTIDNLQKEAERKEKNGEYLTHAQIEARNNIAARKIKMANDQRDYLWEYLHKKGLSDFDISEIAHGEVDLDEITKN